MAWEVKKLGDVCEIFNGSTPLKSNKEYWDNGTINWFTIKDIRSQGRNIKSTEQKITSKALNECSIKLLPINTVLICCTASVGEWAFTEIEVTTNQQFNGMVIKNKNQLFPKYLYYFSSTLKDKLISVSGKTTIDFVSMTKLKQISIPVPPLLIQKQIVSILDEAFEKISKAKENSEKNLKNAKEVFESYLQNVFENKGEGWEEKKLKNICDVIAGQSPEGKYYNKDGNGLPFYQGKKEFTEKYIGKPTTWTTKTTKEAEANDVLMSVRAPVGPINFSTQKICIGRGLAAIRTGEYIDKEFLFNFLLNIQKELVGNNGAVFNSINKTQIENFKISLPSKFEQIKILSKLNLISQKSKKLSEIYSRKLSSLEELKQSILQKAFNGELTC